MRTLVIADQAFAVRERSLLTRLVVGLADEGVRVGSAIPSCLLERAQSAFPVGPVFGYEPKGTLLSRASRVERFVESLQAPDRDRVQFDIVHVFGGSIWNFAIEVARKLEALAVYEVWRPGLAERARSFRAGYQPVAFFAPSAGIERLLLREGAGLTVRLTPWGTIPAKNPGKLLREDRETSMVLISSGRDTAATINAFLGACAVLKHRTDLLLFVDADAANRAGLWKIARREELVDRISIIDAVEERRDLAVRCDIMLYPEARGEQRTILIDAMGAGMAVIAAADPMAGAIVPDITARVVSDHSAEIWQAEITRLLDHPDQARALGRSARQRIRNEFRASSHIRAVIDAYEWLLSSKPISAGAVR